MSVIETALTRLLQIKHPILLAPMGSASGQAAAAVTHAGGLGISVLDMPTARPSRRSSPQPECASVWVWSPGRSMRDRALDTRQPLILQCSCSFGSPMPLADAISEPAVC
jgi:nitronate monooxygenase